MTNIILEKSKLVKLTEWESLCYNCGKIFRNYNNCFSKLPPRNRVLINVRQKIPIKTFCSADCKLEYIYSLMNRGDWSDQD